MVASVLSKDEAIASVEMFSSHSDVFYYRTRVDNSVLDIGFPPASLIISVSNDPPFAEADLVAMRQNAIKVEVLQF